MILTVFFGLMCLGSSGVMGDDLSWLPDSIPWPSQQCMDLGRDFVGECKDPSHDPWYRKVPLCRSLKCALPKAEGGYSLVRVGRPMEGTICGILKACHKGKCIDFNPDRIPTQTGSRTVYDCTSLTTTTPKRHQNVTNVRGHPYARRRTQFS